ncbi:outer membrane protein assembly factor BamC [Agarivorans sp. TSD2052]|uniref:outer membrane protein assembly factor BamC n=1 Tax=Agarivorans sp. TSD2052 TaxID=2937286 RepID=UPI00200C4A86|nr:outer membrane protein assembly factor BamC [Agarivorans sp. TSD2052]UPW19826.1 outer membrane protein assembly factor BamC [Agarivorans sp. TSD2052]
MTTLMACSDSAVKHRQAERDFDYLDVAQVEPLVIPEGVKPPNTSNEFNIPSPQPDGEPLLGGAVDVRSPVQIIPLIAGSRTEKTDKGLVFWFDILQSETAEETSETIMQLVTDYITYRNSSVDERNDEQAKIASNWLIDEEVIEGGWFTRDKTLEQRQKFTYQIDVKPHGRTAGLTVDFVDAEMYRDGSDLPLQLDEFDKERLAIVELNRLIGYVSERREALEAELVAKRESERLAVMSEAEKEQLFDETVSLVLVEDGGASYYRARANMEKTMKRLRLVLPIAGFTITDYIENSGSLFLSYDRPPEDVLESYGLASMEFEEKDYLFTVGSNGNVTQITLADAEGVILKPSEVKGLYPYLAILMKMGLDTSDSLSR